MEKIRDHQGGGQETAQLTALLIQWCHPVCRKYTNKDITKHCTQADNQYIHILLLQVL